MKFRKRKQKPLGEPCGPKTRYTFAITNKWTDGVEARLLRANPHYRAR